MPADQSNIRNHAAFIWSVADLQRGDYKQSENGQVILPMTVLRRFLLLCLRAMRISPPHSRARSAPTHHPQPLITAAVTGEIDVPGVAA